MLALIVICTYRNDWARHISLKYFGETFCNYIKDPCLVYVHEKCASIEMNIIETSHVIIGQYHIHRGVHFELIDITIDSNIAVDETSIVWS